VANLCDNKPVDDVVRSLLSPGIKHEVDRTTRSRGVVIWNFQDGGLYDVITDVIRSESTIRENSLDNPQSRTFSLFQQNSQKRSILETADR